MTIRSLLKYHANAALRTADIVGFIIEFEAARRWAEVRTPRPSEWNIRAYEADPLCVPMRDDGNRLCLLLLGPWHLKRAALGVFAYIHGCYLWKDGMTALDIAVLRDDTECIQLLEPISGPRSPFTSVTAEELREIWRHRGHESSESPLSDDSDGSSFDSGA